MPDCIYALVDPRTDEIRYVGKTGKSLNERLKKHLGAAKNGTGTYLLHWLHQLLDEGLIPEAEVLEAIAEGDDWQERERWWIRHGHSEGWPLTNATAGGEGLLDPSPEVRRKWAEAAMGNAYGRGKRSRAFCRRMATVAKLTKNALGHSVSEKTREGISENLKAYYENNPKERNRIGKHFEAYYQAHEPHHGERHGMAKLTERQVREIRQEYAEGNIMQTGLGRRYGIDQSTVSSIVRRKNWRHIM